MSCKIIKRDEVEKRVKGRWTRKIKENKERKCEREKMERYLFFSFIAVRGGRLSSFSMSNFSKVMWGYMVIVYPWLGAVLCKCSTPSRVATGSWQEMSSPKTNAASHLTQLLSVCAG